MSSRLSEAPSYLAVHYLLRPAKNVQRKMICEALQRLSVYQPINRYQYVGFGSVYFGDFCLFHKQLGIETMTTIEAHEPDEQRVRFNLPYACVDVKMGTAAVRLPEVDWNVRPSVTWLDYDYSLDGGVLADIGVVASRALPFSVIIVTVDGRKKALEKVKTSHNADINEERFKSLDPFGKLEEKVGSSNLTPKIRKLSLKGDDLAEAYRQMIANTIRDSLSRRTSEAGALRYKQLFNFRYSDGQEMVTVGGLIFEESQLPVMSRMNMRSLKYYSPGKAFFRITAPKLTYREIRELNRGLPTDDLAAIEVPVPEEDKYNYGALYRYFPSFTEAEV